LNIDVKISYPKERTMMAFENMMLSSKVRCEKERESERENKRKGENIR
jgi:hypothetical protein